MKKTIMLALALLMSAGAFAQRGEMSIGLRGSYFQEESGSFWSNSGGYKDHFGVGLQFTYGITDGLRVAPGVNYFFKHEGLTAFDANVDLHYLIPIVPRLKVYPILGASIVYKKSEIVFEPSPGEQIPHTNEDTEGGVNLGAGVQFDLCRNWFVNADYTYKAVSNVERGYVSLGVGFRF